MHVKRHRRLGRCPCRTPRPPRRGLDPHLRPRLHPRQSLEREGKPRMEGGEGERLSEREREREEELKTGFSLTYRCHTRRRIQACHTRERDALTYRSK